MSDTAETAGAIAAEVVEAAVEQAQQTEAIAQETAEAIAVAAMETERGARISRLEERMDQWQTTLDSLPAMLAEQTIVSIQAAQSEMRAEMNSLLSAAVEGLRAAESNSHQSLTPLPSEPEPVPVAIVEPAATEAPPAETLVVEDPAKKKRHRFL